MDASAQPRGALEGLRVLEVTGEAGQHCGRLLAGLGAEVVRAEPPEGSPARRIGPFYQDRPDRNGSLYFWHYNAGKRSVTLNLSTPDGQRLFRDLARTADVVLESMPPGWMAARGLGPETLRRDSPQLIYSSVTPYGQTGPWSRCKASDFTLMASGGQMGVCGYDVSDDPEDTPIAPGGGNAWHMGDNYACIAILIALQHRDMTGMGDWIDLSTQDAIALCTEHAYPHYVAHQRDLIRQTGRHATATGSPQVQVRCADGQYANCFMPRLKPEEFQTLVEWLDSKGLAGDLKDESLLDPEVLRGKMGVVLDAVRRLCGSFTAPEIFHGGQQRKFPWTVVRAPSELLEDAHLRERCFFVQVEHPELGRSFMYPGAPFIMHRTPYRVRRRAPLLGEDNVAVYHRELGVTLERLNALAELGVI